MPEARSGDLVVRFATPDDLDWLAAQDDIPAAIITRKIAVSEMVIAALTGQRVGFLRLEYLWSTLPYIAMIRVIEAHRQQGIGRALLVFLASYLRDQGHSVLLSSSQADEPPPQAWHRHMGFEECGILSGINAGGVGEVFFRKTLT
jgi:ribosomal protein S18 acetylase RimI-like enzyme